MKEYKISGFADEIDANIEVQFEVLNKLGIEYFEPRGINGKNISELNEDEVKTLKEKMNECGIAVSSIGSPIGKIKLSDDFSVHFDVFKRVVETAKVLGTKYIRMFSFFHEGGAEWTADEREQVFVRIKKMLDYAKENDVILLHENEKEIYGDTTERCLDLMKKFHCDNFKAVFDPANFVQCGQDTKAAYDTLKDYIEYMHIKDAKAEVVLLAEFFQCFFRTAYFTRSEQFPFKMPGICHFKQYMYCAAAYFPFPFVNDAILF